jgi:hypothetical protein
MDRRRFLLVGVGPLAAVCLLAKDHGRGKGKGRNKHDREDDDYGRGGGESHYFRHEHYGPVQQYYSGPRDLPPGLRKKYYRTGKLPPGWQRKMRPFPPELVRVLPPPPPYCERGYIDGYAVVYDRRTRVIVDTLDILDAIGRR